MPVTYDDVVLLLFLLLLMRLLSWCNDYYSCYVVASAPGPYGAHTTIPAIAAGFPGTAAVSVFSLSLALDAADMGTPAIRQSPRHMMLLARSSVLVQGGRRITLSDAGQMGLWDLILAYAVDKSNQVVSCPSSVYEITCNLRYASIYYHDYIPAVHSCSRTWRVVNCLVILQFANRKC